MMKTLRFCWLLLYCLPALAQQMSASEYNNLIIGEQAKIQQRSFDYTSYSVHSEDIEEIVKKRIEVELQIELSYKAISALPDYKGDTKFRDEALDVFKMYRGIYDVDYKQADFLAKNKNNSFEALKDYYNAVDKASKKMELAVAEMSKAQKRFADRNNMTLTGGSPDNTFGEINRLHEYQRVLSLAVSRVTHYNKVLLDGLEASKAKESDRERLLKAADESMDELKSLKPFNNNVEAKNAAIGVVKFYQGFAQKQYVEMLATDRKKPTERTQRDVDNYNNHVQLLNTKSAEVINHYNNASLKLSRSVVPNTTLKWN